MSFLSWLGVTDGGVVNQRDRMYRAATALMWTATYLLLLPIVAVVLGAIVLATWAVMGR